MDLKLTTPGHDLDIERGDLQLVRDLPAVGQHVTIRLLFQLGEYFLNAALGLPTRQLVLVKAPNIDGLTHLYRKAIATTPGIRRIEEIELGFDQSLRTLSVDFSALGVEPIPGSTDELPVLDYSREFVL